ncbi:MAG: type II secretion system protein GspJ [Myxococcota bacterium]
MKRQRGFSLAEVMIALAILGLIGSLTFGVFTRALSARLQAQEITEHYHMVRQAMLRMTREVSMAFVTQNKNCEDPRTDTLFVGDRSGSNYRLDYTSFGHFKTRADANESDQNELSYFVDADPDSKKGKALFRRNSPRIDDEPDEGGTEQVLARGVKKFAMEFYDDVADRWIDEWDTRDADFRDRLPMFVRFNLTVENPAGKEEEFTTKARIVLQRRLAILGTGQTRCPD